MPLTQERESRQGYLGVVVVEDDEPFRDLFKFSLPGHKVRFYPDSRSALVRLAEEGADVLVVDYDLGPGEPTGDQIAEQARLISPPIRIVMFSARVFNASEESSIYGRGVDVIIPKMDFGRVLDEIASCSKRHVDAF